MSREDIPRSVHTSLGILLRKGRFAYDLEVFQPGSAENKANMSDNFLKLPGGPPWMNSQSVQANYGHQEVKVSKVNVPPVAHFGGSPHLTVFTIHPVTLAGENPIPGSWISVSRLIDEADEQWASVITSIVSQIQYALSVGYISLKSLQKHASRPSSGFRASAAQMNGHTFNQTPSQELPEIDNLHVTSNQENIEAKSREDQHSLGSIEPSIDHHDSFSFMVGDDGNHIGCSDYPRGPHPPLEYESSSHETENDPVIDGSLDSRESVVWNPGNMVRAVSGGRDVQAILDSPGLKLGVVNWHAAWVDSCIDILPFMERLATRFGAVAIIHVDVEASMANKLFAYEKTLTRSESRRKGAKPVVKNGQKFPCITLHEPFNSQPQSYFYGANAIDELALALSKFGNTLNAKPEQPIESQTNNVETQNSQNLSKHSPGCESPENQDQPEIEHPQIPKFQRPAPVPSISEIRPDIAGDESQNKDGNVSSEGSSQRPYQVQILTKGALEFKAILNKAKADKRKLTVLWRLPAGESWQVLSDWPKKVEGDERSVFVSAQVNLNKFNQQLASALAVRSGPFHLQVFEDSKLVEQRNANYLMTTLAKPRERLTESTDIGSQTQNDLPSTTDSESSTHLPSSAYEEDKAENFVAHSAEDKAKSLATKSNQPRDTTYDPPSKGAKTGAKRKLPSGVSTYWPKMPCLQCGCPWWLGEDWEARCARCSWTAETDGYDDDSQPLPKFKADYDKFIALVKEGRTADWHDGKEA